MNFSTETSFISLRTVLKSFILKYFILVFFTTAILSQNTLAANRCEQIFLNASGPLNLSIQTPRLSLRPLNYKEMIAASSLLTDNSVQKMSGDFGRYSNSNLVSKIAAFGELSMATLKTFKYARSRNVNIQNFILYFGIFFRGELIGTCEIYSGLTRTYVSLKEGERIFALGLHLFPNSWGKGVATEAARRLLQYSFEELDADYVYARSLKSNIGSQTVLQKLGLNDFPKGDENYRHFLMDRASFEMNSASFAR